MANDKNPPGTKKPSRLDWKGNSLTLAPNAPATTKNLHKLVAERKAQMATANTNRVQPQAAKTNKEDIFTRHPRGGKKRAREQISDEKEGGLGQKHSMTSDTLDEEEERHRKRKMEEKARLYDDLKRGYIDDNEGKYNVDFDRKWAEAKDRGEDPEDEVSDREGQDDDNELVDYIDEFGRNRRMTKREVAKAERMKKRDEELEKEREEMSVRPKMPDKLIYGDYIQTQAFDYNRFEKEFAAAKERYEDVDSHFGAHGVSIYNGDYSDKRWYSDKRQDPRLRTGYGTGFFQFSHKEDERKAQMDELEKTHQEALKAQKEKEQQDFYKAERAKAEDVKRNRIAKIRSEKQAKRFLLGLEKEMREKGLDEAFVQPDAVPCEDEATKTKEIREDADRD
jgi:hypothetical protein